MNTIRSCHIFLVGLTLSTIAIAQTTATRDQQEGQRPNIVFILADDVGREVLGCYGGTSYQTPHLDALSKSGMTFEHCYSMPVCHPSRIAILTGRYPSRFNSPWGSFPRQEEGKTIANAMQNAGYATAVSGKWQLTLLGEDLDHPNRLGFDEYCLFGWHEGSRYYEPWIWQNGNKRSDVKDRYGPDVYSEFLVHFIEQNRDRPFFAFYSMALCHDVTDDLDAPVPVGPYGRYDSYQEMAEGMDHQVGKIVAALERLNLRENTLVLFTTDNGTPKRYYTNAINGELVKEEIVMMKDGKPVKGGKGDLTDAGTRVPTIASWPATITTNIRSDILIDFTDFLPTFLDLANARIPAASKIDGHSLAPMLRGLPFEPRTWCRAEHKGEAWVRNQRWKLYDDGRLFDMDKDPSETEPIIELNAVKSLFRAHSRFE